MMFHEADDPMWQDLRLLKSLSPDPARAERVRARCRARLQRTRRTDRSATIRKPGGRFLTFVVVGGLCCFYFVDLVTITLRVYGVLE